MENADFQTYYSKHLERKTVVNVEVLTTDITHHNEVHCKQKIRNSQSVVLAGNVDRRTNTSPKLSGKSR